MGSRPENATLPAANGNKRTHKHGVIAYIPTRGTVRMEWAFMFRELAMPLNCSHRIQFIPELDVIEARNVAVQEAIKHDAEFLFFLDDDTFCANTTLHRMFYEMRKNPDWDLITGIVTTKTVQPEPCIFREDTPGAFWDWVFPEVFPIDACGMACVMIRMDTVREKLTEPWFDWPKGYDGETWREEGEDIYFCHKLRDAGGVLMADGGILAGHMDENGKMICLKETDPPIANAAPGAFEGTRILGR